MKMNRFSLWQSLALLFTLLVCAFMIVPVIMSALAGLTTNYLIGLESGLTLRWVIKVWQDYGNTIFLSIGIAMACLCMTLIMGVPVAYLLARHPSRLTRLVEEILMLPVAIPGLATALALITVFGAVGDFRTSWTFILVGHVLFTMPFMVRSVLSILLLLDLRTLEDSAASLGANQIQRFFHVILPNCRDGILAGSLMVLTLSIGEFNLTWLLHSPHTKTLPVGLADAYASSRLEIASAYTLIFFIMIVPLLLAMQAIARPRHRHFVSDRDDTLHTHQSKT